MVRRMIMENVTPIELVEILSDGDLEKIPLKDLREMGVLKLVSEGVLAIDDSGNIVLGSVGSDGYLKTKTTIPALTGTPSQIPTTDDIPCEILGRAAGGGRILSLYQNSGGNLDFHLLDDTSAIFYTQTAVVSGALTDFDHPEWLLGGYLNVKWSAVAGIPQQVVVQTMTTDIQTDVI